jgi:hypothetical protein
MMDPSTEPFSPRALRKRFPDGPKITPEASSSAVIVIHSGPAQHRLSGRRRVSTAGGLDDRMGVDHVSVVNEPMVTGGWTDRWPVAVVGPDCVGSVPIPCPFGRRRMTVAAVRCAP